MKLLTLIWVIQFHSCFYDFRFSFQIAFFFYSFFWFFIMFIFLSLNGNLNRVRTKFNIFYPFINSYFLSWRSWKGSKVFFSSGFRKRIFLVRWFLIIFSRSKFYWLFFKLILFITFYSGTSFKIGFFSFSFLSAFCNKLFKLIRLSLIINLAKISSSFCIFLVLG